MHIEQTLTRFRKTSPKFRRPFALGGEMAILSYIETFTRGTHKCLMYPSINNFLVFNVERFAEYDENDAYGGEKTFSFNVFL